MLSACLLVFSARSRQCRSASVELISCLRAMHGATIGREAGVLVLAIDQQDDERIPAPFFEALHAQHGACVVNVEARKLFVDHSTQPSVESAIKRSDTMRDVTRLAKHQQMLT